MDTLRSSLYQCLAEALAEPSEWLALPGLSWPLFDAALALSRESQAARQAVETMLDVGEEPLTLRQERYAMVVAGPGNNNIGMYESGALNGKILTEITFSVEKWYRQAGLNIAGAEIADHASLELAFLAFLSGQGQDGFTWIEAEFLRQHASRWLPALGRKIAASGDPVFGPVGTLLAGWLEEAGAGVKPGQMSLTSLSPAPPKPELRRHGRLPGLRSTDACTLCSFCVQACPANALSIYENAHSTSLFLMLDRCSGCGKCTRACPMDALTMEEMAQIAQTPPTGNILLRNSERATCKKCAAPMISQAEMAYIADRLGQPGWLYYCLDCRPGNFH